MSGELAELAPLTPRGVAAVPLTFAADAELLVPTLLEEQQAHLDSRNVASRLVLPVLLPGISPNQLRRRLFAGCAALAGFADKSAACRPSERLQRILSLQSRLKRH